LKKSLTNPQSTRDVRHSKNKKDKDQEFRLALFTLRKKAIAARAIRNLSPEATKKHSNKSEAKFLMFEKGEA
jgi:hypothetical protein